MNEDELLSRNTQARSDVIGRHQTRTFPPKERQLASCQYSESSSARLFVLSHRGFTNITDGGSQPRTIPFPSGSAAMDPRRSRINADPIRSRIIEVVEPRSVKPDPEGWMMVSSFLLDFESPRASGDLSMAPPTPICILQYVAHAASHATASSSARSPYARTRRQWDYAIWMPAHRVLAIGRLDFGSRRVRRDP